MKTNGHVIKAVDPGSIAEALELAPGDRVLAINGREIEDIFDYQSRDYIAECYREGVVL